MSKNISPNNDDIRFGGAGNIFGSIFCAAAASKMGQWRAGHIFTKENSAAQGFKNFIITFFEAIPILGFFIVAIDIAVLKGRIKRVNPDVKPLPIPGPNPPPAPVPTPAPTPPPVVEPPKVEEPVVTPVVAPAPTPPPAIEPVKITFNYVIPSNLDDLRRASPGIVVTYEGANRIQPEALNRRVNAKHLYLFVKPKDNQMIQQCYVEHNQYKDRIFLYDKDDDKRSLLGNEAGNKAIIEFLKANSLNAKVYLHCSISNKSQERNKWLQEYFDSFKAELEKEMTEEKKKKSESQ